MMEDIYKSSKEPQKLNTNDFQSHIQYLWSIFSTEELDSFDYFDCLWFAYSMKSSTQGKVVSWIKHKNVFTKKYTFGHWSLLILCHLGGSSLSNPPVMLLLDSLHSADPTRLFSEIKKFVFAIYAAKGREESEEEIASIPLLVPQVPQQVNGTECGFFVLCYIYLFIKSAPHSFSLNDYPYFVCL
ncbi:hypothetical protein Taro_016803, partial [Colocasia esculenta]|nr:hypothetical protein [Colocasia esculenta]